MSTQIHHGCRLGCKADNMMTRLIPIRREMRSFLIETARKESAALFSELHCMLAQYGATTSLTKQVLNNFLPESTTSETRNEILRILLNNQHNFEYQLIKTWLHAYQNDKYPRNEFQYPGFDAAFKLILFPGKSEVYCLPNGSKHAIDHFLSSKNVIEYVYYDNVDCPDTISAHTWQARKQRWDKLLNNIYENAVFYEITTINHEFIHECLPSPDQITAHLAKNRLRLAFDYTVAKLQNEMEQRGELKCKTVSDHIRCRQEFHDKLQRGDSVTKETFDAILAKLPVTYDECKTLREHMNRQFTTNK